MDGLREKTAEQLRALLSQPSDLTQFVNQYVEERAGEAEKLLLSTTLQVRRRLLCELANTKPEAAPIRWFQERWKATLRAESAADLTKLGEQLRYVWGRPAIDLAEQVLNGWLEEKSSPAANGPGRQARGAPPVEAIGYLPFSCSLGAGRLVPDRKDLRAMLIQGVFENWRLLSLCANADCATPHFVAKRKDQQVCDAEICKAEKQRVHALKWWHENRGFRAGGR